LLIFLIYQSSAVAQKRVVARADHAWAGTPTRATQIAMVAYVVGGSFVSIATSPFLYLLAGIAAGTRSYVERKSQVAPGTLVNGYSNAVPIRTIPYPAE